MITSIPKNYLKYRAMKKEYFVEFSRKILKRFRTQEDPFSRILRGKRVIRNEIIGILRKNE